MRSLQKLYNCIMIRLKPNTKIKDYTILKELGSGTSGTVWKAEKEGRFYAIKFYHVGQGNYARAEYDLMQQVEHPNIIDEFGMDELEGRVYMVMDYLSGAPLDKIKGENLSSGEMLRIARELASGLQHAHEQGKEGIIHRDLKPANVFITQPNQTVKILDFGASGPISYNPHAKIVAGSYSYMAPEQLAGECNKQTDIWSFGTTLYKVLTGEHPYQSKTLEELGGKMLLLEVDFPHHLNPKIPAKLSYVIMKCLRKKKSERYRNFREVLEDLEGVPLIRSKFILTFRDGRIAVGAIFLVYLLIQLFFGVVLERDSDYSDMVFWEKFFTIAIATLIIILGAGFLIQIGAKLPVRDLLISGSIVKAKRFNHWIESLHEKKRKNKIEQEYLLSWYWRNNQLEKAKTVAKELLLEDQNNIPGISFNIINSYTKGHHQSAIRYCRHLETLSAKDAGTFFLEKVLQQKYDGKALGESEEYILETLVNQTQYRESKTDLINDFSKKIFEEGSIALPIQIVQHNFLELRENQYTDKGKVLLKKVVSLSAKMILYQDYLEIEVLPEELKRISHIINENFKIPGTVSFQDIIGIALNGRLMGIKKYGWFLLKFDQSVAMNDLRLFLVKSLRFSKEQESTLSSLLAKSNEIKTKDKKDGTRKLSFLMAGLIFYLYCIYDTFFGSGNLDFILIISPIPLASMLLFSRKLFKPQTWYRDSFYNQDDFPKVIKNIIHSGLEMENTTADSFTAAPFVFDATQRQLGYKKQKISFNEVSQIKVSNRRIKLVLKATNNISVSFKNTNYELYIPLFCKHMGDRMELI